MTALPRPDVIVTEGDRDPTTGHMTAKTRIVRDGKDLQNFEVEGYSASDLVRRTAEKIIDNPLTAETLPGKDDKPRGG